MATQNATNTATGAVGTVLTGTGVGTTPTFQAASTQVGSVTQVVSATFTGTASTTSSTFSDTGITVTITPRSATNTIMIVANINTYNGGTNVCAFVRLVRGATPICLGAAAGSRTQVSISEGSTTGPSEASGSIVFLDSPATVAATTYKLQYASPNNVDSVFVNISTTDTNAATTPRPASSITVMEIVA
jgi:hypothetical protein